MLKRLGIARKLDVDDQRDRGKIDPARGDVGRHADARFLVAKALQRVVAFALAVLARQRDGVEAALGQAGMQAADGLAGRAEQDRRFGFVQPKQVDHGMLDVGRGYGDRLVGDVGMGLALADRLDAQRVLLVARGHRDDRARHGGGEQQRAPLVGRRVEDFLQLFAEPHVEHLVGLVEDDDAQGGKVERAPFEMVAKAARRSDDDVGAALQRAAFLHRVHPADAGDDAGSGVCVEPVEFLADLDGELAGRRDHQAERLAAPGHAVALEQLIGDRQPEGHGLARSGLGGNDQVAAVGLFLDDGRLDRGQRVIAARGQGLRERGVDFRMLHGASAYRVFGIER